MRIIHQATGSILGSNVKPANTFWPRLLGFMFRSSPMPYDGIYFPGCNWVHNSFVRFSLDVIFIDNNNHIVKIIRNFRPWNFSGIYFKARHTIELPAGALPPTVCVGDADLIEK